MDLFQIDLLTIASVFKTTKITRLEGYFTFEIISTELKQTH